MLFFLAALSSARAACSSTAADLRDAIAGAERAYATGVGSRFATAMGGVRAELACVTEPLAPADAARVHRVEALTAFAAGDHGRTVAWFAAARRIEPGWELPPELASGDHPLRRDFDRAGNEPMPERESFGEAFGRWCQVDGIRTTELPVRAPFVFQTFEADGTVMGTNLFPARGDPPARAPSEAPGLILPTPVPTEPEPHRHRHWWN